jgi:hypothetical protein
MHEFKRICAGTQPHYATPAPQFEAGAHGQIKTPTSPAPVKDGVATMESTTAAVKLSKGQK